jgi:hypothetical protein
MWKYENVGNVKMSSSRISTFFTLATFPHSQTGTFQIRGEYAESKISDALCKITDRSRR